MQQSNFYADFDGSKIFGSQLFTITARPSATEDISPKAFICIATFPKAVDSVGPAEISQPVASAANWLSIASFEPPPIMCILSIPTPDIFFILENTFAYFAAMLSCMARNISPCVRGIFREFARQYSSIASGIFSGMANSGESTSNIVRFGSDSAAARSSSR